MPNDKEPVHQNAPGMAAFTLLQGLMQALVKSGALTNMDAHQAILEAAVRNDKAGPAKTTTNSDAARLLRELLPSHAPK